MAAAGGLSPEKRSLFLERVAAPLALTGRFTDDDLPEAPPAHSFKNVE